MRGDKKGEKKEPGRFPDQNAPGKEDGTMPGILRE